MSGRQPLGDTPSGMLMFRGRVARFLTARPRRLKQAVMIGTDCLLAVGTMWMAFSLRYEVLFVPFEWRQVFVFVLGPMLAIPIFARFGMYHAIFRYSGIGATAAIAQAIPVYTLLFAASVLAVNLPGVPRAVSLIQPMIFAWAIVAVRGIASFIVSSPLDFEARSSRERLLIFGAGTSGIDTLNALYTSRESRVVGFIDDDPRKTNRQIRGVTVMTRKAAEAMLARKEVDGVLLALPRVSRTDRNAILEWLRPYSIHVRSIPSVQELVAGNLSISNVRDLDIDDLLGRDVVAPDLNLLMPAHAERTVMITGAGGSIGSELCRQLLRLRPKRMLLVEQSEFALYAIDQELAALAEHEKINVDLVPILCDVRRAERVERLMVHWHPTVVYHAAAYKHVPLVEFNPGEGIGTNVLGTFNVARAAARAGVERFVLISTDKAVRPTNVMGASKRFAEIVLQALAAEHIVLFDTAEKPIEVATIFTMVRFGNVLGSSGSVVPLFRNQIAAGGPVTVTHSEVTRYFMSIPEAAQLVLHAGAIAKGGEVFLLDMGEPVRIVDLARRMIELSGATVRDAANPAGDIEIRISGLRPGEKLYEELLIDATAKPTSHPAIVQANEKTWGWPQVHGQLAAVETAIMANDVTAMRAILAGLVDGFASEGVIADNLHRPVETRTNSAAVADELVKI